MCKILACRLSALVLIATFSSTSLVYAEAFRVLGQGNSGTAQGEAFAAQADDASAVFYNPAGMTQHDGIQLATSALFIGGSYKFQSPSGQDFRGDLDGPVAINPPPATFYLTADLDSLGNKLGVKFLDDFAFGIGMNAPFGLVVRWPKDVPFSSVTTFAQLPLVGIKPTVAYKFNEYLSLGIGLDIYTFFEFLGHGNVRVRSFIPPATNTKLDGKDTAIGFNLGFLVTPWRTKIGGIDKARLNLAFVYRSQSKLHLSGDFRINGQTTGAAFDLNLPQIFTSGVAIWPIRDRTHEWKVETDVDYVDWTSFKELKIRLVDGTTVTELRNWKGIVTIKIGTEYKWLEIPSLRDWELAVRGGYIRANSPVPERTFEPRVPNSDFNGFSFGIGLLCKGSAMFLGLFRCENDIIKTKAIGLDLAYKNQLYDSRTIRNNIISPTINGTYNTELHMGSIGFRANF